MSVICFFTIAWDSSHLVSFILVQRLNEVAVSKWLSSRQVCCGQFNFSHTVGCFGVRYIMQPEATWSYCHGEKYVPLALKITSISIGKMDLTACFQTLIQLICEVVCQINQSLNWLTPDRELVLSSISSCSGFSVFLSCHHGLCFCFETQEPLTSFSRDVHFDREAKCLAPQVCHWVWQYWS